MNSLSYKGKASYRVYTGLSEECKGQWSDESTPYQCLVKKEERVRDDQQDRQQNISLSTNQSKQTEKIDSVYGVIEESETYMKIRTGMKGVSQKSDFV